jgi:putative FmdB family regulatory protein
VPIYEYRCENGHQFDVMQSMSAEPLTACETCGAPVQRVFHPIAVHFKGKGFYNTDYGTRRRNRELEKSGKEGAAKSESKAKETSSASSDGAKSSSSDKPAAKKD